MKSRLIFVLFLLCIAVLFFCACGSTQPERTNADQPAQEQEEETIDPNYRPYQLIYESIGDGTCRVVDILPDREIEDTGKSYILTIPEYSPDGERVTGVLNVLLPSIVPYQISAERFEQCVLASLREGLAKEEVNQFSLEQFLAYYQYYDLSEAPNEQTKEMWLRSYPILQKCPIYVLAEGIDRETLSELQALMLLYNSSYTYRDLFADYREVGYRMAEWGHIIDIQMPEDIALIFR